MAADHFDNFRAELDALRNALFLVPTKTVRDAELQERIRTLCRVWISSVQPTLLEQTHQKKEVYKLAAEVEALAALTNKRKPVTDYKKRISQAVALSNQVVIWLPPSTLQSPIAGSPSRIGLFLEEIPDLPSQLVPNALLGWRESMKTFLSEYPFDRSVFLMIRYRDRNERLVTSIKQHAARYNYNIILARDHRLTDDLYNPIACLLCCTRGLAVFDEPETEQVFNPNVAYELGMMHLLGRDCRVLKHADLQVLHTDILMKLYSPYKDENSAIKHLDEWFSSGM